jgi:protein-S-isoprenylcysteine O-methyltransferase Ste14
MGVLTILCIACFPVNPLVLVGLLKPGYYLPSYVLGWIVWAVGMILVMAPIVMFPRRGGVPKGKSFVHTTRLVDTGIYGVVRHPPIFGGNSGSIRCYVAVIPSLAICCLGYRGSSYSLWSTRAEERRLPERFGGDYEAYMQKVPRMNLILGILRLYRRRKTR